MLLGCFDNRPINEDVRIFVNSTGGRCAVFSSEGNRQSLGKGETHFSLISARSQQKLNKTIQTYPASTDYESASRTDRQCN